VIRLGLALVALTLPFLSLPTSANSQGELRLNDARHRLVIRVEAKGTGYAYYGQYVYAQQAPSNGHATGWSRLRKKSRAS